MEPIVKQPRFVLWLALVVQLPIQLFLSVWFGGFVGAMSKNVFGSLEPPHVVFGIAAFLAILCVTILGKKLNYARTEYSFFDDHVEVVEGFFSRQMKSVAYQDVCEVTLKRGFLQRLCGLGSMYLGTLATGSRAQFDPFDALGFENVSASGVTLRDLPDPDVAYAQIRERIDAAKRILSREDRL